MPHASCFITGLLAVTMAAAAAAAQTPAAELPLCPPPAAPTDDGDGLLRWAAVPLARGTTAPRLVRQLKPQYTSAAMRAGMGFSLGRSARPQVAERMAAPIDGVFYDEPAHGFRVTLLPLPGLVERKAHCFVPVPPERRVQVAQTMVVYVQPTRFRVDERASDRPAAAAVEPWLVVLDGGDGHVIFDQALGDCREAPPAGAAVSLLREQPATTPTLIKAGDFNTTGATKPGDKGQVEVEFTVLPDGRTADLRISRSVGARPAVEAAALAAARTTTYKPATKGGLPVAVRTTFAWGFEFLKSDR